MFRHTTWLAGALLLAACQNSDDPNRVETTSGKNLGSAEWETRHEGERRIDLPPRPEVEVKKWQYRDLPERYQEMLYTDTFLVMVETLYGYNGFRDKATPAEFRGLFEESTYDEQPLPVEAWDIRYDYPVQYATFEIGGKPCVAAFRTLGDPIGTYKDSALHGFGCGEADTPMQAYREQALSYFARIDLKD